jgi:hypothetical protein
MYREETYIRKFEEANGSENLDVDGKIILKYILNSGFGRLFTRFI